MFHLIEITYVIYFYENISRLCGVNLPMGEEDVPSELFSVVIFKISGDIVRPDLGTESLAIDTEKT
jgi:hypothetical protein